MYVLSCSCTNGDRKLEPAIRSKVVGLLLTDAFPILFSLPLRRAFPTIKGLGFRV